MFENERSEFNSLLQTKLFAPSPKPGHVQRSRLLDRMNQYLMGEGGFARKLTLVAAPAGYGKTTLISQWLPTIDVATSWLSLEAGDNDPTRFIRYLIAALQLVSPNLGRESQAMLRAPQRPPDEILLTALINDLVANPELLVLVLDDYHVIQTAAIHQALNFLIEHIPETLHLVIATREDPPVAIPRLQARGQALVIRQADLAFTNGEATEFFRKQADLELDEDEAAALANRTEGWVTGLQLAALSMKSTPNQDTFIESFAGSDRYILDYLFEEVFEGQSEEIKSFLLQTATLNRINAALANTITGRTDSHVLLEHLEHANFFIVPLDQSREWYRYHRLFVDLLRHRLSKTAMNLELLHGRASHWYRDQGYLEEAIEHALAGGHWKYAGELINEAGDGSLRRGEVTTLLKWCRRMPEDVLLGCPDWGLTYAWPLILIGEAEEADRVLRSIKYLPSATSDSLQGQIAAAEAFLSRTQGDITKTIEVSKKALALLPEDDRTSRGTIAVNLGLTTWHIGQLDEAELALREGLVDTQATGNHYAHHTAQVFLARTHASRGDLSSALDRLEQAMRIGDQVPTAVLAHCDMADIHFERNRLDSAWQHSDRAAAIAERTHNVEFQSVCCIQRALIHLGLNDAEAGEAAFEPALAYSRSADVPLLTLARIKSCQVQLALARGDSSVARQVHASIPLPHDAHTFYRFIDLNSARIHLADGEKAEARKALDAARERAVHAGWIYALYVIRVLQALAAEEMDTAVKQLQPAIQEAEGKPPGAGSLPPTSAGFWP
jgi:LuxR family maltose regulon positive regulatory protein